MSQRKPRFFEPGGGGFFVNITTTSTREVFSSTSTRCFLVKTWEEVIERLRKYGPRDYPDSVEIFTKPRLCEECRNHAAQPVMFDKAKDFAECLCWIEKDSRCDVHNSERRKGGENAT